MIARKNELREPILHIGLCTHHEPRSTIFKLNVIGQNFLSFLARPLIAKHKTIWRHYEMSRAGIGNEFLKIARRVEPLIGSGISSLISYSLNIDMESFDLLLLIISRYLKFSELPKARITTFKVFYLEY